MKKIFFYIAIIGWLISTTVHLLSVANIDIEDKYPYVWLLHIGIFIVWLPAVINLTKNQELKEYQKTGKNPFEFLKILFKDSPTWLTIIVGVGFVYTFINFALYHYSYIGMPDIMNGQYVLQDHGSITKTLTEQEYHYYQAKQLRGFSGHWVVFYGMAAALLYPFAKKADE